MAAVATVEELETRQTEIGARLKEIDTEYAGKALSDETRTEWNDLNDEREGNVKLIDELRARHERLLELDGKTGSTEQGTPQRKTSVRGSSRVPEDIYDVAAYRGRASSPDDQADLYREGAKRAIETATFPHDSADQERVREHIARLLVSVDGQDGELARRILETGSPVYQRAFGKYLIGQHLTPDEQRALSIGTTTAGGFAVPFTLDPTIIPTSNGSVNPIRQLARVETITGNEWRGISSGGITASYADEVTEAGDNSPVLAQPTANVEKAQAFVPFSIEVGQDWQGLQTEMAKLFQDAKDDLEAVKFITGLGHTSHEPEGLLVGATAVVTTASTATLAVADLYSLVAALPPRFVPRASILAHKGQFHRVRQFDTAGGANLWTTLGNSTPANLLGYPTYEDSSMVSTTSTGSTMVTIGDFSKFLIVDRVGLNVELIPHLFATANNRPSGQRGLYAYWRNTSKVLAWQAFRSLKAL